MTKKSNLFFVSKTGTILWIPLIKCIHRLHLHYSPVFAKRTTIKTHCETSTCDIFGKLHQLVSVTAVWHKIFSSALTCCRPVILYIQAGASGKGWVVAGTGLWKSNDISPCLSVPLPACRCQSRLAAHTASSYGGSQSNLHLPGSDILKGSLFHCFDCSFPKPFPFFFLFFSWLCQAHIIFS